MRLTKFLISLRLSTFACNQNQREYVLLEMLRHFHYEGCLLEMLRYFIMEDISLRSCTFTCLIA